MATASVRAPLPDKWKGRPVVGGGLSENFNNSGLTTDNRDALRLQCLLARGVHRLSAPTIAALVWEGGASG